LVRFLDLYASLQVFAAQWALRESATPGRGLTSGTGSALKERWISAPVRG
jgi:hypothetical protein